MSDLEPVELPILSCPADGVPAIVDTAEARQATLDALAAGHGPVAVDVERAQSYRYSGKAYLLQLKRAGSGIHLIDPIAFESPNAEVAHFSALYETIRSAEWIVHAASQDLPNLVQLGLAPTKLFDTELAGRLLGLPKVSLGAMVEQYCGVRLLKEHAAADWSLRPIPHEWLVYAALDVELLGELRDHLHAELVAAGKQEWAAQEFAWLCRWAVQEHPERPDRWRRTSGMHQVHHRRGLALVRELWRARDEVARNADKAPGKIVPDAALTELAALVTRDKPQVPSAAELRGVLGFKRRSARAHLSTWFAALDRTAQIPANELPPLRMPGQGVPAPRAWEKANPEGWQRWNKVRPAVLQLAEELSVPVENLLTPDALRQLLWQPTQPITVANVSKQLADMDARPWQIELVAPLVVEKLSS